MKSDGKYLTGVSDIVQWAVAPPSSINCDAVRRPKGKGPESRTVSLRLVTRAPLGKKVAPQGKRAPSEFTKPEDRCGSGRG